MLTVLVLAWLTITSCSTSDLLDVETPDIIDPGDVRSPSGANAVRIGALSRFIQVTSGHESGGTGNLFVLGGLFADEWVNGDTFIDRQAFDRREIEPRNAHLTTVARNIGRALLSAEQALTAMDEWLPDAPGWQAAEMHLAQAYVVNLAAEHFCNGLVFSTVVDGEAEYGVPMTTASAFERALGHTSDGIALITGASPEDERIRNALDVTRGRILMNLDRPADAAQAVADVPTDFLYMARHSQSSFDNGSWQWNNSSRRFSVSDAEGVNGLNFASAGDPRVPICVAPCPQVGVVLATRDDASQPLHVQLLWTTRDSAVALTNGIEARMIEAEAQLRAGSPEAALATINAAREILSLEPLADAGTPDARLDQLFRERAFWFFGRGHRMGELRRLVRQYGRPQDAVFPTGNWHKAGATYGSDVNFPVPLAEANNPNVPSNATCMDRNP